MSMIGTKTPDEVKDYSLDWSKDLGADTVANNGNSIWTVSPSGVSVTQSSIATNGTLATVWLSGGTAGQVYHVKNFRGWRRLTGVLVYEHGNNTL